MENWLTSSITESGHKIISKEVREFGNIEHGILYIKEWTSGRKQIGYVFNYRDKCYSFWNEDFKTQDLFLKMLSTFRFVEVDKITDWKTYINEELKIDFELSDKFIEIFGIPHNTGVGEGKSGKAIGFSFGPPEKYLYRGLMFSAYTSDYEPPITQSWPFNDWTGTGDVETHSILEYKLSYK